MAYEVKLQQFEGPLDLLLELIEAEKLDVSQVSLAHVTDGYLKYVQEHPEIPPEELADFLVVASRLLFIKSRILLPFLQAVAEAEEGDLESQLRIYKEYLDASKLVEAMIGKRRFLYVHEKLPHVEIGFAPPKKLTSSAMADLLRGVIARLEPVVKVPRAIVEKTVSIHEKIRQIQSLIATASNVKFSSVLASAESRTEVIVCFLALLELVKQRSVVVEQEAMWGDIVIANHPEAVPAA